MAIARKLMEFKADPFLVDGPNGFTPVHAASLYGARELLALFLQCSHQPNLDHPGDFGTAALSFAAIGSGCPEVGFAQRCHGAVLAKIKSLLRVAHVHGRPL